jgi:hypothetical protein
VVQTVSMCKEYLGIPILVTDVQVAEAQHRCHGLEMICSICCGTMLRTNNVHMLTRVSWLGKEGTSLTGTFSRLAPWIAKVGQPQIIRRPESTICGRVTHGRTASA